MNQTRQQTSAAVCDDARPSTGRKRFSRRKALSRSQTRPDMIIALICRSVIVGGTQCPIATPVTGTESPDKLCLRE